MTADLEAGRPPHQLRPDLWLFPPNRDCQGGSSWWLQRAEESVLIDCPPLSRATLSFLERVTVDRNVRIVLTSREGHGRLKRVQDHFGWPVLVQEQEAYLLPGVAQLESFSEQAQTSGGLRLLWTPGPTPGSCVVLAPGCSNLLFCGRLLTPLGPGRLGPMRHARTFHWSRQLLSLKRLRRWIPPDASPDLASGAGLGALRGARLVPFSGWEVDKESS